MKLPPILLVVALLCVVLTDRLYAQSTAFSYQGSLSEIGEAAAGTHDFEFRLFDAAVNGSQVDVTLTAGDVEVVNGLFTAPLDFGMAFDGTDRYLEISVRPGDESGGYTALAPRQLITATPYALKALEATTVPVGTITSDMLANGSVTSAKIADGAVNELGTPDGSDTSVVAVNDEGLVGIGTDNPQAGVDIATGREILSLELLSVVVDESGGYTNLDGASYLAAEGELLVVTALYDRGITLLNIADKSNPTLESQIRDDDGGVFSNLHGVSGVDLSGTLLAVAAYSDDAVTLINVTDSENPSLYATLQDGDAGFDDLDNPTDVAIEGDLMAIAAKIDDAVTLVNVSNPESPALHLVIKDETFGFNELDGAEFVELFGDLLVISAVNDDAVTLVDVSIPSSPVLLSVMKDGVGGFNHLADPFETVIEGNLLIVASSSDDAITLVNIADRTAPELLSVIRDGEDGFNFLRSPRALSLTGNTLAITAFFDEAVTLVDVSDPGSPQLLGVARNNRVGLHHLNAALGVVWNGSDLIVAGHASDGISILQPVTRTVNLATADWVGVGTSLPLAPLHVTGNVIVDSATEVNLNTTHFSTGNGTVASGIYSTAMGNYTEASGDYSAAMGSDTTASGDFSTAIGRNTVASADYSTAMGSRTIASGLYSTAMGQNTEASGNASTAMGLNTTASGSYSTAMGRRANANHNGTFVWSDSINANFASTANNQFLIRAAGGVGIGTTAPEGDLHVRGNSTLGKMIITPSTSDSSSQILLTENTSASIGSIIRYDGSANQTRFLSLVSDVESAPLLVINRGNGRVGIGTTSPSQQLHVVGNILATGTITPSSDRNVKKNFAPVVAQEVLDRVAKLPIQQWTYKAEDDAIRHVGPMAQDFHAAFGLGENDVTIATVDADGVALAAIQGLNQKLEDELEQKETEIAELKARLDALEKRLTTR